MRTCFRTGCRFQAASISAFFLIYAGAITSVAAAEPTRIPLEAGLRIVTAILDKEGDYESIKTVEAVTPDDVKIVLSAEIPFAAGSAPDGGSRRVTTHRTVLRADLRTSHEYMQVFNPSYPLTIPGSTAIGTSSAVLNELKTKGQATFTFETPGRNMPVMERFSALIGKNNRSPITLDNVGKLFDASKVTGILQRIEPGSVPFPMLINGRRTSVPAIHARGKFAHGTAEFYFLDDPDNPLALKWMTGNLTGALQVIQITYHEHRAGPHIEQALKDTGRAEVHGIYFDFGSATIKPESEADLQEIGRALAKNPSWTLVIEGHTDNIGSDATNTELSKQRAEAVKRVLVSRYHIDAVRLSAGGFGASRPKESNETPEGRARNRRVELVRR